MATIDLHANISIPLALEFEGRARNSGMSAEKYLKTLMNLAAYSGVATTQLQRDIVTLVKSGLTDAGIAVELNCSAHYVIRVRNKMGLPPNKKGVRLVEKQEEKESN